MKKVCVIGYPAKHSLSPVIHKYWLDKYDIEGSYEIREIEPDKFDDFFLNLEKEGYVGCNITVPYKERAFELADAYEDSDEGMAAMISKAVNTIYLRNGILIGKNTDYKGFVSNLESGSDKTNKKNKVVMLGAGGAARAVIMAGVLVDTPEFIITNRSKDRAEKIVYDLEEYKKTAVRKWKSKITIVNWQSRNEALKDANLLVNTTSLGMVGQPPLDIDLTHLPKDALVTDIVYRPLITPLLQAAKDRGNPIVDGLGMLLHQAAPGFEMWFAEELKGRKVEVTLELRAKIEALL